MSLINSINILPISGKVKFSSKGIPICQTRVVWEGVPWVSKKIAIHPRDDRVDIELLTSAERLISPPQDL